MLVGNFVRWEIRWSNGTFCYKKLIPFSGIDENPRQPVTAESSFSHQASCVVHEGCLQPVRDGSSAPAAASVLRHMAPRPHVCRDTRTRQKVARNSRSTTKVICFFFFNIFCFILVICLWFCLWKVWMQIFFLLTKKMRLHLLTEKP